MNCFKGVCKYQSDKICDIDKIECDYKRAGMKEHCRQENNEELCGIDPDTIFMEKPFIMPFFSCQNLCKHFDTCIEE